MTDHAGPGLTVGGRVVVELNYTPTGAGLYDQTRGNVSGTLTDIGDDYTLRISDDVGVDVIIPWHAVGRLTVGTRKPPRHPAL